MTALSLARVAPLTRSTRLLAASAAVAVGVLAAAPLAAGAQVAPVGQSAGLMEVTLQQGNSPLFEVVQPKLLLSESPVFDEPPQRPVARLRDALTETQPHLIPDFRPLPGADPIVTVNPEPSTLALLAGAGALLGVVARRRRAPAA